jgi:uncharacterized protein YacL
MLIEYYYHVYWVLLSCSLSVIMFIEYYYHVDWVLLPRLLSTITMFIFQTVMLCYVQIPSQLFDLRAVCCGNNELFLVPWNKTLKYLIISCFINMSIEYYYHVYWVLIPCLLSVIMYWVLLYFTIETKQEIIKILFHGTRNNSLFPRQTARRSNNYEGICM